MSGLSLPPYHLEPDEIARGLATSLQAGLDEGEARRRLLLDGENVLPTEPATPLWRVVLEQFEDRTVRILLVAAFISFVLAFWESSESRFTAFVEPFVILAILIANAVVGVWQERSAEQAIEALKSYAAPHANVKRDGVRHVISAKDLVVGDVIEVADGDMVPADCRLVEMRSTTVRVQQAVLTGESTSKTKFVESLPGADRLDVPDQKNMLFSGTEVVYGKGVAVVTATGRRTEFGKIDRDMKETEADQSPMQKKLDEFGDFLSKVIMGICVAVWIISIPKFADEQHGGILRAAVYYFKIAVALAVAAIPEGLPAVVTTCLALGSRRMARRNAIVRHLPSVETLGCTTVICSDKTGTLTSNMMSASKIVLPSARGGVVHLEVENTQYDPTRGSILHEGHPLASPTVVFRSLRDLARACSRCNESRVFLNPETGVFDRTGEATEAALRVLVEKIGVPANELPRPAAESRDPLKANAYWESRFPTEATLEFTRDRKAMSVLCVGSPSLGPPTRGNTPKNFLFVKGAPEGILARSTKVELEDGNVVPLTEAMRNDLLRAVELLGEGGDALRLLGVAHSENMKSKSQLEPVLADPSLFSTVESELTFVGIVGMLDPPRPEVRQAIEECRGAGIRVVVITGDAKPTAEAVCRRIGLLGPADVGGALRGLSFTGKEFDSLSESERLEAARHAVLFSRTEPSHKLKLVNLFKEAGEICAMTGDGVNDAPALKRADIGIAMGSGTDVAKGASAMILSNDNFAAIVSAVEEGRSIFNNTKQFIRYLISSNIGEVVCIFLTTLLGTPEALVPVQLLWMNLVTDGLPATALGFNPPDLSIMKKPPRRADEPIVNRWLAIRYFVIGFYVGLATVAGFLWWYMYFGGGPLLSYHDITHWSTCVEGSRPYSCAVFHDWRPMTVALTILVTIEMFNALNAVSEDQSLLTIPFWANMWLVYAVFTSFALHFLVLYVPFLAAIFEVSPLGLEEWIVVILLSFPVILIDEVLKWVSRTMTCSAPLGSEAPKEKAM